MKKTIVYPIKYSIRYEKTLYQAGENDFKDYINKKMIFPLNHVILNDVSADDEICVLLVETIHPKRELDVKQNVAEAKEEIDNLLSSRCKAIEYKEIKIPLATKKEDLGIIYKSLCKEIIPSSNIFVDFTFGQRYMLIILFCVLNYSEKYLDCSINRMIYGLYDSKNPDTPGTMLDLTTLYLLNSFGAMFDGSKSSFDTFVGKILK